VDLAALIRNTASLPDRVLRTGLRATAVGVEFATAPLRASPAAPQALQAITDVARELLGGAAARRHSRNGNRYWIEVHRLADAPPGDELVSAVPAALCAHPGVVSATMNVPLSRVVVETTGSTEFSELCGVIAAAEQRCAVRAARAPVDLPGDPIVVAASVVSAAANVVGLGVALAGRAMMWPRLPGSLSAVVTLVDYQPRLRRALEERFGHSAADTAIALAAAATYAVTLAPASLAVDAVVHAAKAAEIQAAAAGWRRREPHLARHAHCADPVRAAQRPCPLPPGPVERHGDRSGLAQALAAPVIGILTADVSAAATAAIVAAPKAARTCREMFAATLGRGLTDNHGVLPLRPKVFRHLDRVDAVVVDPRALCTGDLQVGRLRDVADPDRAAAWRWAQHQLDISALAPGWSPVSRSVSGTAHAAVLVRYAPHPLAAAVLGEIRRSGAQAVSVDLDTLDELRSYFDDLDPLSGSIEQTLAGTVHRLQAEGRTVAVVSRAAAQALALADVAIGVGTDEAPAWHAHLLAEDLDGVWRIVHALPSARRASKRGVEISTGASLLGALLMIPGVRGVGPGPVTAGAAAGAWTGYRLARAALSAPSPPIAVVHEWHAMSVEQVRDALPPPTPRPTPAPKSRLASTATSASSSVGSVLGAASRAVGDFAGAIREELSDPLTPVLAVGSAASAVLGSPLDAALVGSVLGGNAALAATQRIRAERLLQRLLAVQDPPARVRVSSGGARTVPAAGLRPGDVIEVRPGEVVAADARLIEAADVEVDESALTGESLPVGKHVEATPAAPVAERACMLHATTTVVAGTATAIVTAVGAQTQARRAAAAPSSHGSTVGLQAQLRELTNRTLPVSLAGGGLVTALGLLRLTGLRQAVASGVAVSVAAVPEGLPLVATLAQQASARRLTRAGALVRSPRSVEALGRVDVVCFDKTGTLSENRLRVTRVHPAPGCTDDDVLAHALAATPPPNDGRHGHATDDAIAAGARHLGTARPAEAHLPFRSGRAFSASLHGRQLSLKGAPEVLLAGCADGAAVARQVSSMAADGLRVIAVARRDLSHASAQAALAHPDALADACQQDLQCVGLLGISDTARPDAAEVVAALARRGIAMRLITGDHPVTAAAIAAELGISLDEGAVISGSEWEALSRRQQERAARQRVVFARMSPENKVQIVETLERLGAVCAMVGDGANDAAAIRAATVGIGVASRGSDPARTAADVMLLDGRISALLDALDEGRQLWRRVQAAVAVLLGGNAGEVVFAIVGTALTGRAPLNTRQLLLVNMLTDALPAAALAVSPPSGARRHAGRGADQAALWRTVAVRGSTTAGAATTAWLLARFTGRARRASTVGLVALVATQLGQTLIDSHSPLVIATAAGSLGVLGAAISTPGLSQLLGSTPLGPVGWSQALSTAAAATAVAAIAPRVVRALGAQSSASMTPARNSTAYNSRTGTVNSAVTAPVNGSGLVCAPLVVTLERCGHQVAKRRTRHDQKGTNGRKIALHTITQHP
jgi:cation-transporting ATPase I